MLHSIFVAILVPVSLLVSTTQAQAENVLTSRATPELPGCAVSRSYLCADTCMCGYLPFADAMSDTISQEHDMFAIRQRMYLRR